MRKLTQYLAKEIPIHVYYLLHIFYSTCCEDYLGGCCPECQIPAHVKDAEVDRQLFTLASLCARLRKVLNSNPPEQALGKKYIFEVKH